MGAWEDEEEDDADDGPEVRFDCKCGRELAVPVDMVGGVIECPYCQEEVRVPGGDEEEADGAPPDGEVEGEEAPPARCPSCAALCDEDECPSCHVAPHLSLNPQTFFRESLRFLEDTPAAVREATFLLR